MVNNEQVAKFLEGRHPEKYIVGIEIPYGDDKVNLIINNPETGKTIKKDKIKSFLWFKEDVTKIMYGGKRNKITQATKKFGVKISRLKTSVNNQTPVSRIDDGFKFMAKVDGQYSKLLNFFKQGGIDVYGKSHSHLFMAINPVEQYLIQSGKRLFKGFEDYDELHRLQFDLETTGLYPKGTLLSNEDIQDVNSRKGTGEDLTKLYEFDENDEPVRHKDARIFQIGVKDNRGFEEILEINPDGDQREEELLAILKFFEIIKKLEPDTIAGYNSENFDWSFIFTRCDILGVDIEMMAKTLDPTGKSKITRKDRSIKYGGETEYFKQTSMFGYNILDVYHAVRRAKAINSNIKSAGLKYITKYTKKNKPNRVYVEGNKIYSTWADRETPYAFNNIDGKHYPITDEKPLEEGYDLVQGRDIVRRYLLDDLWETEKVDEEFNQAAFLLSKIIPTSYSRSTTMGTAGTWKLIMMAWSFENRLALPATTDRHTFTGGLSRLLEVGYRKNVVKLDFAALYPNIEITHDIFPDVDISGAMKSMLLYIANTRDTFKALMNEHKGKARTIDAILIEKADTLTPEQKARGEKALIEHKSLAATYDKKQLPIKILGNSFFGSLGAPNIFNWGDLECAEETTCRGRQYLRLMVKFFVDKGFTPLVGDSVTFDTPIYIRWKDTKLIDIKPICDLYNPNSDTIDEGAIRDYEIKPYEVLTVNGWKEINYVYRHGTDKKIHRVSTKDKLVCVTEDHSLFQNGKQVKPSTLKRGDLLDVTSVPIFNNSIEIDTENLNEDLAYLYGYFLGDGSAFYGDRKQYYKSKKTNEVNVNKGKRSVFKISSSNYENLVKLQKIFEENFKYNVKIKDHLKSSGVYNLICYTTNISTKFHNDFYTSYREKKVPSYILNTSEENKKAFLLGVFASDGYGNTFEDCSDIGMKSQVAMSGIGYLMDSLEINKKIRTRKDKENFISFRMKNKNRNNSPFTEKTKMESDEVWLNEVIENRCPNGYVYDISTEDGTFVGGIGGVDLKNTDGFNFAIPDNVDDFKYIPKGTHRFTEPDKDNELIGLDAVVGEFNELYMIGRMGLDIDDICETTINFARKNYANLIDGKIKFVGNTIKSSKMPGYIEDFLEKGIGFLLDGDGHSFVQLYNKTVEEIYNFRIPLVKIASKSSVKESITAYIKDSKTVTKSGSAKARKAHMELVIRDKLKVNLGDTIYYVNTGTSKSHGDVQKKPLPTDEQKAYKKEHGKYKNNADIPFEINLNCMMIPSDQIENNPELTTSEYNVPRYLAKLNSRIKALLVCFSEEIRSDIMVDMVKNKETKEMELTPFKIFTKKQCELTNGNPLDEGQQDNYANLMVLEDKEIQFWIRNKKEPNNLADLGLTWQQVKDDYNEKKRLEKINGIKADTEAFKDRIKRLEVGEIEEMKKTSVIPMRLANFAHFTVKEDKTGNRNIFIISTEWGVDLGTVEDIFKYESWAVQRSEWYLTQKYKKYKTFEFWLKHLWSEAKLNSEDKKASAIEKELLLVGIELDIEDYNKVEKEKEKNGVV